MSKSITRGECPQFFKLQYASTTNIRWQGGGGCFGWLFYFYVCSSQTTGFVILCENQWRKRDFFEGQSFHLFSRPRLEISAASNGSTLRGC